MSGLFAPPADDAMYLSRRDPDELLGTYSAHQILLDDDAWPTAEHYFQAMRFNDPKMRHRVRDAATPAEAHRLGEPGWFASFFRRQRADWEKMRRVYMTRAVYTKCKAWDEVAERLLDTGNKRLIENDQYDYLWGCGRDLRGENLYGQVLMDVRARLREEAANP